MAKFITIGYGDETGYRRTDSALRKRAHEQDAELVREGALVGIAGAPCQVRNPQATGALVSRGAYMRSELPIAGFAVIEADDIEDAIRKVSGTPCSVAYGVVEIWPLTEPKA